MIRGEQYHSRTYPKAENILATFQYPIKSSFLRCPCPLFNDNIRHFFFSTRALKYLCSTSSDLHKYLENNFKHCQIQVSGKKGIAKAREMPPEDKSPKHILYETWIFAFVYEWFVVFGGDGFIMKTYSYLYTSRYFGPNVFATTPLDLFLAIFFKTWVLEMSAVEQKLANNFPNKFYQDPYLVCSSPSFRVSSYLNTITSEIGIWKIDALPKTSNYLLSYSLKKTFKSSRWDRS